MIKDIEDKYFKKVYVDNSTISGFGLFAGEPIKQGEIILVFGGCLAVSESRYSGEFLRSTCVGVTEDIVIGELSSSEKQPSDFINHSCEPNMGMLDAITLVAIRDVQEGEELLCDYSFWENNEDWKMKTTCCCGSKHCRKTITGKDWKLIKSNDLMFRYYSPYLRRRILKNEKR